MTTTHNGLTSRNVLSYVRRSIQASQEDTSPAVQREMIRKYADAHGLTIVGEFSDLGRSGWDPSVEREGWQAVRERVAKGDIGAVLAYRADRFSRKGVADAISEAEFARSHGTALIATDGRYDSRETGMGALGSIVTVLQAQEESQRISERVNAAKALQRERGEFLSVSRPFGMKIVEIMGEGMSRPMHRLAPCEYEAPILNEVADAILDGQTLVDMVTMLNDRGVRNTHGNPWRPQVLRRALRNPNIAGYQCAYNRHRPGTWTILTDENGEYRKAWEPAISPTKFWKLSARFTSRRGANKPSKYMLSRQGLLMCGNCGGVMNGTKMTHKKGGYVDYIYRCMNGSLYVDHTRVCMNGVGVNMAKTDAFVRDEVRSLLANLDPSNTEDYRLIQAAAEVFNDRSHDSEVNADRARLTAQAEEIAARMAALTDSLVEQVIDPAHFRVVLARLKAQYDGVAKELAALPAEGEVDVEGVLAWIDDLRARDATTLSDADILLLAKCFFSGIVVRRYDGSWMPRRAVHPRLQPVYRTPAHLRGE